MNIFRVIVACLFLCGCGAQFAAMYGIPIVNPARIASVSANVSVENNPHTGAIEVVGPMVFYERNLMGDTYLIRSWIKPQSPRVDNSFQIVVIGKYPKRVYLKQAYANGRMLSTTMIDRERKACSSDCIIDEVIGINLTEAEMAGYASTGLSFQILGRRASLVMSIPPAYFAAVLKAHREARQTL